MADYVALLAIEAAEIRDAHGGNPQWWVEHSRAACAACREMDRKLTRLYGPLTRKPRCECPDCGANHWRRLAS